MDFLETTMERNPKLVETAFELHKAREIPTNTYLVDLDSVKRNAIAIAEASASSGIKSYFMTKQFGRNPILCKAIVDAGIRSAVAIDIDEAKTLHRNGFKVDHVGHLLQIPSEDIDLVVGEMKPEIITVYGFEKAREIDRVAKKFGVFQKIMLRPIASSDLFGETMESGTPVHELDTQVKKITDELRNLKVAGLTSFPSFRFDLKLKRIAKTSNFETLLRAKSIIESRTSTTIEQINAPGGNCAAGMKILSDERATHAEPGHAFTGTTPWHAFENLEEIPAWVYVTEVSHTSADRAYSFSGGLPQSGYYGFFTPRYHQAFLYALVEKDGTQRTIFAEPPHLVNDVQAWPDFYTTLHQTADFSLEVGDTVVFGFRPQVYVSRSTVTVVEGLGGKSRNAKVVGTFDRNGNLLEKDGSPAGKDELRKLLERSF